MLAVLLGLLPGCQIRTVSSELEDSDRVAYDPQAEPGGGILKLRIPEPGRDAEEVLEPVPHAETPPGQLAGNWSEELALVPTPVWSYSKEYWWGWLLLHLFAIERDRLVDPRRWRTQGLESLYVASTRTGGTHDRFTRYIPPAQASQVTSYLTGESKEHAFGFFLRALAGDTAVVGSVVAGSPAHQAGLRRDDRLLELDGEEYRSRVATIDRTRPQKHSLSFYRPADGRVRTVDMTTSVVRFPSVWADTLDGGVGYVQIIQFLSEPQDRTDSVFVSALAEMQAIRREGRGWILDLRGNGGGTIASSQGVAGALLGEGVPLVRVTDRDLQTGPSRLQGVTRTRFLESTAEWKVPVPPGTVLVLQDQGTASASEILINGLRENLPAQAMISFGTLSYGKGIGQVYLESPLGGLYAVTCMHIDPLQAPRYHGVGIEPDRKTTSDEALRTALLEFADPAGAARLAPAALVGGGERFALDWNRRRASRKVAPLRTVSLPGGVGIF
ncbi:MAG: hypothetical protein H6686_05510 [Fibrobacteria bacterium]|nr:hypothetical protein [Fibrobacteria bacterium]